MRPGLCLFTYLHLAAYPAVAEALLEHEVTGIAYETVQLADGALPLLAPMSEVAGRMSAQIGAHFLERHNGGRGVLLGGAPGVRPARVVVLGAGNVGWNAAWMAAGLEAEVDLLDRNVDRLRFIDQIQMGRITTLTSNRGLVERTVVEADLVIGAVLVPGGRAPVVVDEAMVKSMKPGAVIVDIAIDQGGCIETSHETTHKDPVFELHGVVHYCVGNMPGAVPNTSTYALTNVTLPYLAELARLGLRRGGRARPGAGARCQHGRRLGGERGGGRGAGPARSWIARRGVWQVARRPMMNRNVPFPLDDIDKAIIRELQVDGRMAYAQLGPKVGLVAGRGAPAGAAPDRERGHAGRGRHQPAGGRASACRP